MKIKPKCKLHEIVRTAGLRRTHLRGDTTNWSYKLYEITENINDTIPRYHIDKLPQRYNEASLKRTKLTMKENDSVMKKVEYHLDQLKIPLFVTPHRY